MRRLPVGSRYEFGCPPSGPRDAGKFGDAYYDVSGDSHTAHAVRGPGTGLARARRGSTHTDTCAAPWPAPCCAAGPPP
jgi:hypothetical protein